MIPEPLRPYAKAVAAFVVSVLVGAVAQGLIVGQQAVWVNLLIGVLNTGAVFTATNKGTP